MKKVSVLNLAYIISIMILLIQCHATQKLHFPREDYKGTLRLDGFYYSKKDLAHFFLYNNGIKYNGGKGGGFMNSIQDIVTFYADTSNYKNSYILPYCWGIYKIVNDEIIFSYWLSYYELEGYATYTSNGKVLNDTMLILNRPEIFSVIEPPRKINIDTFYFYPSKYKPDSTNKWIK